MLSAITHCKWNSGICGCSSLAHTSVSNTIWDACPHKLHLFSSCVSHWFFHWDVSTTLKHLKCWQAPKCKCNLFYLCPESHPYWLIELSTLQKLSLCTPLNLRGSHLFSKGRVVGFTEEKRLCGYHSLNELIFSFLILASPLQGGCLLSLVVLGQFH